MPKNEKPTFGKRNVPEQPKQPTGHEALPPIKLTVDVVRATYRGEVGEHFFGDLRKALDDPTNTALISAVAVIIQYVDQGRSAEITAGMIQGVKDELNKVRGKK